MKKATLVKKISATQEIWTIYYEFSSFGISPRVFTVLQVTHYDSSDPKTGCVHPYISHCYYALRIFLIQLFNSIFVSIPVDLSSDPELAKLEEQGVKGRYVSVESIKELSSGNTEWRMATSSSPGGRIPAFVVESTMASTISEVSMPSFNHAGREVLISHACDRTSHTSYNGSSPPDIRPSPTNRPLLRRPHSRSVTTDIHRCLLNTYIAADTLLNHNTA